MEGWELLNKTVHGKSVILCRPTWRRARHSYFSRLIYMPRNCMAQGHISDRRACENHQGILRSRSRLGGGGEAASTVSCLCGEDPQCWPEEAEEGGEVTWFAVSRAGMEELSPQPLTLPWPPSCPAWFSRSALRTP